MKLRKCQACFQTIAYCLEPMSEPDLYFEGTPIGAAPATMPMSREEFVKLGTRTHQFTVDACGGDAELICVLQKVMERFRHDSEFTPAAINQAAVAEWFYAKYGPPVEVRLWSSHCPMRVRGVVSGAFLAKKLVAVCVDFRELYGHTASVTGIHDGLLWYANERHFKAIPHDRGVFHCL